IQRQEPYNNESRLLRPFYRMATKGLMFFKFVRAASSIFWSVFSLPYSFLRKTVIGGRPRLSIRSVRDDQILILVIRTDLMHSQDVETIKFHLAFCSNGLQSIILLLMFDVLCIMFKQKSGFGKMSLHSRILLSPFRRMRLVVTRFRRRFSISDMCYVTHLSPLFLFQCCTVSGYRPATRCFQPTVLFLSTPRRGETSRTRGC